LEKEKKLLIEFGIWAKSTARPSLFHRKCVACAAQSAGVMAQ
jgi:hypothetical protein